MTSKQVEKKNMSSKDSDKKLEKKEKRSEIKQQIDEWFEENFEKLSTCFVLEKTKRMFLDEDIQIPKKLLIEAETAKKDIVPSPGFNFIHSMSVLEEENKDSEELHEYIRDKYNMYRRENKYMGAENKIPVNVICLNGDNGESIDRGLREFISNKEKAVCFTYNRAYKALAWLDKQHMDMPFKLFKKRIKEGTLCIDEHNNQKLIMNGKSKWYVLVFQSDKEGVFDIDLAALKIFNFMVNGMCYFFNDKKNRDKMYKWLIN